MKDIQSVLQKLGQLNQPLCKLLSASGRKCFSKEAAIPQWGSCRDQVPMRIFISALSCSEGMRGIKFLFTIFVVVVVYSEEHHCFFL